MDKVEALLALILLIAFVAIYSAPSSNAQVQRHAPASLELKVLDLETEVKALQQLTCRMWPAEQECKRCYNGRCN